MGTLTGVRVAIVVDDGFEEVEMTKPRQALEDAGAETRIVSPRSGKVRSWDHTKWSGEYDVQEPMDRAQAAEFDALLLPGGVMNPDHLRMNDKAVGFVKEFFAANKPVAAICHGPWMVIEADAALGRRIASWPSLRTDLANAGAQWKDQEVVVDGNLVSSREPDDIPAFNREMIKLFGRRHTKVHSA